MESVLHDAILTAIGELIQTSPAALDILKQHIGIGLAITASVKANSDDPYAIQARIGEITRTITELVELESKPGNHGMYADQFESLFAEKKKLKEKLDGIKAAGNHESAEHAQLDRIFAIIDGLRNRPLDWDEQIIRQMIECIKVVSKTRLTIRFRLGIEMNAAIEI
ncbi:MAG: hypothetical protein FWD16_00370 [Clostridia bacterium]|nr:hypothetical protein [Clostridia bacterium]